MRDLLSRLPVIEFPTKSPQRKPLSISIAGKDASVEEKMRRQGSKRSFCRNACESFDCSSLDQENVESMEKQIDFKFSGLEQCQVRST